MNHYEMRRPKQALSEAEISAVVDRNSCGVLSLCGEDGVPYGVPLNYVYGDGCFYFHCGKKGRKIALLNENKNASFCVIDKDTVIPEKFATDYISVIASGVVETIDDEKEKYRTIRLLADRLGIDDDAAKEKEISSGFAALTMLRFRVTEITGKVGLYLRKKREDYFPELYR